jgi:tripartite-type tricarboxylate transporter receptor subunit TctC
MGVQMTKRPLFQFAVAAMALGASAFAFAQGYPEKVVKFIVPFSAGGVSDVVSRPIAHRLGVMWGHQTIIENRPGAGGMIGSDVVAKAKPDGYTLLLSGSTHFVSAALHHKAITFHPIDDFTPIAHIAEQPGVLVVHPSVPAKSLAELIAMAKAHPGKMNYASSGNGSSQHLFAAMLFTMVGIELTHVPYKGSGPALADLLSGLVPVSVPSISNAIPHIQGGKLRALGVSSAKRVAALPDVPTLSEAGARGYDAQLWFAVLGPKGLPADIVNKVFESVTVAVKHPDVQKTYAQQGIDVRIMPPAEFTQYFRSESVKWNRVVKEAGVSID